MLQPSRRRYPSRPSRSTAVPRCCPRSPLNGASSGGSPVARAIDLRADAARLRRLFQALDERLIVSAAIARERLVPGSRGQPRLNPLAGYQAQLTSEIERALEHFGMTPLARFRLGIEAGEAADGLARMQEQLDRVARRAEPLPRELASEHA